MTYRSTTEVFALAAMAVTATFLVTGVLWAIENAQYRPAVWFGLSLLELLTYKPDEKDRSLYVAFLLFALAIEAGEVPEPPSVAPTPCTPSQDGTP